MNCVFFNFSEFEFNAENTIVISKVIPIKE